MAGDQFVNYYSQSPNVGWVGIALVYVQSLRRHVGKRSCKLLGLRLLGCVGGRPWHARAHYHHGQGIVVRLWEGQVVSVIQELGAIQVNRLRRGQL